jgi:hypothetical protein
LRALQGIEEVANIGKHFTMRLTQFQSNTLKALADFAEIACEQFLRIAEIFLMLIAEQRLASESPEALFSKAVSLATALRELTAILLAVWFRS